MLLTCQLSACVAWTGSDVLKHEATYRLRPKWPKYVFYVPVWPVADLFITVWMTQSDILECDPGHISMCFYLLIISQIHTLAPLQVQVDRPPSHATCVTTHEVSFLCSPQLCFLHQPPGAGARGGGVWDVAEVCGHSHTGGCQSCRVGGHSETAFCIVLNKRNGNLKWNTQWLIGINLTWKCVLTAQKTKGRRWK